MNIHKELCKIYFLLITICLPYIDIFICPIKNMFKLIYFSMFRIDKGISSFHGFDLQYFTSEQCILGSLVRRLEPKRNYHTA